MEKFSIILALDNENGIGKTGDLAWDLPEDRKYFKNITKSTTDATKQNAVIMWRKTWDSIPEKFRPFSWRKNYILSRSHVDGTKHESWALCFSSLENCLEAIKQDSLIESIFVVGWAQIYNQVLNDPCLEKAYITRVYDKFHCDVFFDGLPSWEFREISRSEMQEYKGIEYEFLVYQRKTKLRKLFSRIF